MNSMTSGVRRTGGVTELRDPGVAALPRWRPSWPPPRSPGDPYYSRTARSGIRPGLESSWGLVRGLPSPGSLARWSASAWRCTRTGRRAVARGLTSDLWPTNQPSTWSNSNAARAVMSTSRRRCGERSASPPTAATSSDRKAKASRAATVRRSIARNPLSFTQVIAAFSPCLERVSGAGRDHRPARAATTREPDAATLAKPGSGRVPVPAARAVHASSP
jgi:hypothetical protein